MTFRMRVNVTQTKSCTCRPGCNNRFIQYYLLCLEHGKRFILLNRYKFADLATSVLLFTDSPHLLLQSDDQINLNNFRLLNVFPPEPTDMIKKHNDIVSLFLLQFIPYLRGLNDNYVIYCINNHTPNNTQNNNLFIFTFQTQGLSSLQN